MSNATHLSIPMNPAKISQETFDLAAGGGGVLILDEGYVEDTATWATLRAYTVQTSRGGEYIVIASGPEITECVECKANGFLCYIPERDDNPTCRACSGTGYHTHEPKKEG